MTHPLLRQGTLTVTPTGERGVWKVQDSEQPWRFEAVYRYESGLWRCSLHPGIRTCREIRAVREGEGL